MASAKCFEDLRIWQKARELCSDVYRITAREDFAKDYRLKDQLRGSSGSVMDNIAEGFERNGNKEFIQFLYIAKGSCGESRSQIYRALDCKYITQEEFEVLKNIVVDLSQDIAKLIKYLQQSEMKGSKFAS